MTILALDLGRRRTGVALSHGVVAEGLTTLDTDEQNIDAFLENLKKLVKEQAVGTIVIGLPLGKDGKETQQSVWVKSIADKIKKSLDTKIVFTEESYSSSQAKSEEGDIDQQSARIILEQYLNETRSSSL